MKGDDKNWPAWFNSPDGKKSAIFESPDDVPKGWTSGAEKRAAKDAPAEPKPEKVEVSPPSLPRERAKAAAEADKPKAAELDAHGHAYDSALHAATKSKTKDGLWRMKVGVKRPAPAPGYPLDL